MSRGVLEMKDLFEPSNEQIRKRPLRGKMRLLALWLRQQSYIPTSDVVEWGIENYYVSALRVACILAERGYLRRMTDDEVAQAFERRPHQGVWVPTQKLLREDLS